MSALLSSGVFGEFDREISEQIEHWQTGHLRSDADASCTRGRSSSFAEAEDSNSFTEESEEEDERYRMASVETVQSSQAWDNNCLEDACYKDSALLQLVNLLKNKTDSVGLSNVEQLVEALLLKCSPRYEGAFFLKNDAEMIVGMAIGTEKKAGGKVENKEELIQASPVLGVALPTVVATASPAPPPPPPPPPPLLSETCSGPPPPPPLQNAKGSRLLANKKLDIPKALKPKAMPKAGSQMKQIQWTKIPVEKVIGDGIQKTHNVWMSSARLSENELHLNFDELESMFSCAASRPSTDTSNVERRTTRKNAVITLLSHKRSFNVSIFLKQFKEGTTQIVENVRDGNGEFFGLERLNNLRAVLPDSEEIEILRGFSGDQSQLGIAEQFFLSLLTVSDYRLILDCMILKEELDIAFETLLPHIDTIINSCIEIKESKALPKIFCMLVQIGNFLNANAAFGNAAGFRLNSLWRILDVKGTQKSITLLHFIAMQDRECTEKLLSELLTVPVAARLSLESIRNDVRIISDKLTNVSNEVRKRTGIRFFEITNQHFMNSQEHMENMQEQLEQMDQLISYLAAYFCEDEKHFKIEECFKILSTFICRLGNALSDNEKRIRRLKRLEERSTVENVVSDNPSKFNLSERIEKNSDRTLEELLESNSRSDTRHSRPRSNISQTNTVTKSSSDERKDRKIVHRSVRKLRDEITDEGDEMSPIMKLRKQSRNKSDAYLIRHSQNLDEFLEVAERVEKEAVKQCNKELPHDLAEATPTFSTSTESAPSECRKAPPTEIVAKHTNSTGATTDVAVMLSSTDTRKQGVAVERTTTEIPLSKTIRSVRTSKSVQKTPAAQPCAEASQNSSSYAVRLPTVSMSRRKSASEQQPTDNSPASTTQPSATSASTTRRKIGAAEQTCDKSKHIPSKSFAQPGKPFTTITNKEAVTKRRNEMVVTYKSEIVTSRTTKNMPPRKPRFGTSGASSPSVTSARNTTPQLMTKKSTTCTTDAEVPCTSNSSTENSPQRTRTRAANEFATLAGQEQSVAGSKSFWGTTYRSTHIRSVATATTKGAAHSNDNSARPISLSNHDSSSSAKSPSTASRPNSIPQRILAVSDATSLARATPPSRSSPSTSRRFVRGTSKSRSQVSNSAPVTVPSPYSKAMKRADSCSTASRPLLIKTGAVSRPRWK
ncbi:unnamed protein product [Litomosoides sigmodontis]|uniref:FH2 domain-containing protein n=1 Tax=Litomosoides sigmodontis TaxID=42156 RepID=A0A3P6SBY1_LITSI|nr:unnamed protein product [Litomosoides sigmodontis]